MTNEHPLELILDRLHKAVRETDFAALGPLTKEAEHLLDHLGGGMTQDGLARIRRKAHRNASCLSAAARGLRAARRRQTEVLGATGQLVTYDGQGRRADVTPETAISQRF
jgi:hypothetical protein